jgi:hypothetical protein
MVYPDFIITQCIHASKHCMASQKYVQILCFVYQLKNKDWDVVQVLECLPSKCKALSLIPVPQKQTNKQ